MRGAAGRLAWAVAALLCVAGLPGCDATTGAASRSGGSSAAGAGDSYEPTRADEAALRDLMRARARAVRDHDLGAFRATVDPQQARLLATETTLFRNLTALPLSSLTYDVSTTYTPSAAVPGHDPVLHPDVLEQVRLRGTVTGPVTNQLDLTFVRRDGRWLVGADRPPGAKGTVERPQERPWFGKAIAVRHDHDLTVLVDADARDTLDNLVESLHSGIARDAEVLGVEANERVLVDATSNGVAQSFDYGADEEVGAVTFTLFHSDLARHGRPVGTAIKVNPKHVDTLVGDDQLLWHELTHFLLTEHLGTSPVWLSEGVAAWSEWQPARMSQLEVSDDLYDRLQKAYHELPIQGAFYTAPDLNYPIAQAAVQWLVDRAGVAKLRDFMDAFDRLYKDVDTDAITPKALRQVYGISEHELVAGTWATLATLQHH